MEAFGSILSIGYLVGWLVSGPVYRVRAGLSWWSGMAFSDALRNFDWFLVTILKVIAWPVLLVLWIAQGNPPSPWRLNDQGRIRRA